MFKQNYADSDILFIKHVSAGTGYLDRFGLDRSNWKVLLLP